MNHNLALSVKNISKSYLSTGGQKVPALKDISFTVQEGETVAIVGPTGAGKSTILRIITGIEMPDKGQALVCGLCPERARDKIGYLSQEHNLFPWLKLIDNVSMPYIIRGMPDNEARQKALGLLKRLGLEGFERLYPYELSGGMRQRGSLARLLATEARYWLLDEPFSFLDERTRHTLQKLLLSLAKENSLTVLMVTHSADEAVYLADRVLVLSAGPGRIIEEFQIPMPRPRDRLSPEYLQYLERIRQAIEKVLLD